VNTERLAETFVDLADTLVDDFDLLDFLYTLVDRCAELLDVSAVGLVLADPRGRLHVMAATSEEARLLELFQLQNDEGPCLECFRTGDPITEFDLATAGDRWPQFAPAAVAIGFRSVHARPMRLRNEVVGALNLFHVEPDGLPTSEVLVAQALADVATIGMIQIDLGRRQDVLLTQLQTALNTRRIIEQAKGVLAERNAISPTEAFTLLRSHAQSSSTRLSDLAEQVVEGQRIPTG
jgi:GAF domain-containing protein